MARLIPLLSLVLLLLGSSCRSDATFDPAAYKAAIIEEAGVDPAPCGTIDFWRYGMTDPLDSDDASTLQCLVDGWQACEEVSLEAGFEQADGTEKVETIVVVPVEEGCELLVVTDETTSVVAKALLTSQTCTGLEETGTRPYYTIVGCAEGETVEFLSEEVVWF